MATFGSTPGVRITTAEGTVGGITIGSEQYLVLAGVGKNSTGTASTNTPAEIVSRTDADEKFGENSDIATAYRKALRSGANPDYIQGIMADTTTVEDESFTSTSGELANSNVVADTDRITVEDGDGNALDVEFVYGDTPSAPDSGAFALNPHSGEWATDSSYSDLTVTYDHADWSSAIEAVPESIAEGEFGLVTPLTNDETLVSDVQEILGGARQNYKMLLGLYAVQPNSDQDGAPWIDVSSYTNSVDDDRVFMAGPTASEGADPSSPLYGIEDLPVLAGHMSGAPIDSPVYNDVLPTADPLAQKLSKADAETLRGEHIIPLRDRGSVRVTDNVSTYNQEDNGGWTRDYFRRRVVDLVVATTNEIAERTLGAIADEEAQDQLAENLSLMFDDFANDLGVLERGGQFVDVYRKDRETFGVDLGMTPLGVAKQVEVTLTVQV